ncbi:phospholipid carrier-dependent glycosyltransferase [Microgenomates group bacterium]|nr:phospholipid carrier-dependent glycosyltransferase [Microgenomates group bacterium]
MKKHLEKIAVVGIVVLAAFLRVNHLSEPSRYYFDEVYHIPTARLIMQGDKRAFEWTHGDLSEIGIEQQSGTWIDWLHPPLNKYGQALSMKIWGADNSFSWRISSAAAGVGVVVMVYSLLKKLFPRLWAARLVGAGLVAIEPMLITQSRIGMNDMMMIWWMLLGVRAWLWSLERPESWMRWGVMSAVFGLAIGTKWSVALIAPVILVVSMSKLAQQKIWRVLGKLELTVLIILLTYLLIYSPMLWMGKSPDHLVGLHQQIWAYQNRTDLEHYAASGPREWVWGQKEVYYNANDPDIYLRSNLLIMTAVVVSGGLTAAAGGYLLIKQRGRLASETQRNMALLLALYGFSFLPWTLSPRIMFLYHYLPALTFGLMLTGVWAGLGVDYLRNKLKKTS